MIDVRWVTAFCDSPTGEHEAAVEWLSRATGWAVTEPSGPGGAYRSLLPDVGDVSLRVQRLDDGTPRIHLDLYVEDLAGSRTEALRVGAEADHEFDDCIVMRSPGGMVFCLVGPGHRPGESAPSAVPRAGGHRSAPQQLCLDIPPRLFETEQTFWVALTGWHHEPGTTAGLYRLRPPPGLPWHFLLQRLDDDAEAVSAHLDWRTTDVEAEVARHVGLGAVEVARGERGWVVMRGPDDSVYCLTPREPIDTAGDWDDSALSAPAVPLDTDEVTGLRGFLDEQRTAIRRKVAGLDEAALRQRLAPSSMSLGGLLAHLAFVEDNWFSYVMLGRPRAEPWADVDWKRVGDITWDAGDTRSAAELRALFDFHVARADRLVDTMLEDGSLDTQSVRRRGEVGFNLRWVLLHMIEEYARHAGHADLIRESIDGQTGT